ncbi:MAG TPA: ATP-dependent DNA helicase UvrD2 [Candidatus Limnocylindrales bacterium]|nr:ATP-dependent DNA helicase UvrD2 [Candidatus Limnocylindrales bacterium]
MGDDRAARLLDDLNEAQRGAVQASSGPLVILAGAGTGKTRVISRRAAYAIETGVVPASRVLLVTFTDKAANEMVERMATLGQRGVMARTFHSHAVRQLRHFWPSRHGGDEPPQVLESKLPLIVPLVQRLPGGYRFTPARDLADTIEWAKVRRIPPARWVTEGADRAPIPADLFGRLYASYERAKDRARRVDFEDMLALTVELLESDADAARLVQSQKTWISVDEYQDTNPLQERLLELWTGESPDLAVVGDPDQTIYTFTGATPDYLLRFADRHPGTRTIALTENYRSTPQVLALANRLTAGGPRGALTTSLPAGPEPTIDRFAGPEVEVNALVAGIRRLVGSGVGKSEIAVLVRINAQLPPIEEALTRAGVEYTVRGQRFYGRAEVRQAGRLIGRSQIAATGGALVDAVRQLFAERLGYEAGAETVGDEGGERAASLSLLLTIASDLVESNPEAGAAELTAELDRRDAAESAAQGAGVNLLTYHRAKGLEWDAVFLPAIDEGTLPIRQAKTDEQVAEERRLLYVGITRARTHVALSWSRRPSRFLAEIRPRTVRTLTSARAASRGGPPGDDALLEALREWRRERAKQDAVPAYVIAHDSTLAAIADDRPQSMAALRRVKGMGPLKLDRYGAEILAILSGS